MCGFQTNVGSVLICTTHTVLYLIWIPLIMLEYHSDYRCYLIPQAGVCAYNFQNLKMLNRTII